MTIVSEQPRSWQPVGQFCLQWRKPSGNRLVYTLCLEWNSVTVSNGASACNPLCPRFYDFGLQEEAQKTMEVREAPANLNHHWTVFADVKCCCFPSFITMTQHGTTARIQCRNRLDQYSFWFWSAWPQTRAFHSQPVTHWVQRSCVSVRVKKVESELLASWEILTNRKTHPRAQDSLFSRIFLGFRGSSETKKKFSHLCQN